MNREQMEELVSREIDGALSPAERATLEQALRQDPSLVQLRAQWLAIRQELAAPDPLAPTPEVVWQDVRRAIRTSAPVVQRVPSPWRMVWAAATLVALIAGSLFTVYRMTPTPEVAQAPRPGVVVEYAETDLPGASTLVYEDPESGVALVWITEEEPVKDA